ncbi:TetR/AcrR family transcriptional regulator [Streptomyces sp. KR80]|uniref:TetR/AcrR family transcriptional regulator n=1 Tax=Streptomyces sp. KR80 TaxID=3457426 RepID=UPI003FCF8B1D
MARLPADVRRAQLVEAAIRVMARDGVARATTRAIVSEAGMPLGFFHYCFRSKQELLQTVMEALVEHSRTAAMQVVGDHRTVRDAIHASLQGYWSHVEANPEEHLLTYELTQFALRQPGFEEAAGRQYAAYLSAMTEFLEAIAGACRIEWTVPLPILARYAHTAVEGVTLLWLVERDSEKAQAVLGEAVDHLAERARPRHAPASPE